MNEINESTLGARLLFARILRGFSQEGLADKAGVSQSSIGDTEVGKVKTSRNLAKIAKALRVSFEWLAEGVGQEPSEHDALPPVEAKNIPGYVRVKFFASYLGAGNTARNDDDGHTEIPGGLLFREYSLSKRGLSPRL